MFRFWSGPWSGLWLFLAMVVCASGCVTTSEPVRSVQSASKERPSGFFERLVDNFSERECNVGRFTCPYGFGSAGEPCDCVGPNNVVFTGRTVK